MHKLANTRVDECHSSVQNETLAHCGRKNDLLYRARRLRTTADKRLDDKGRSKLLGLLAAGDPRCALKAMWHAIQVVRSIYEHTGPVWTQQFATRFGNDLQDPDHLPGAHLLGRTLLP